MCAAVGPRWIPRDDALDRVLEAAERHARELLGQAPKYEKLATPTERLNGTGQQAVANETMRDHYKPLREAIDLVKERRR